MIVPLSGEKVLGDELLSVVVDRESIKSRTQTWRVNPECAYPKTFGLAVQILDADSGSERRML
jgi:hypothetical protein